MKKKSFAFCVAALAFAACNNGSNNNATGSATTDSTVVTKTDKTETWVPVDSATEMKAWQEFATPGAPHKMMAKADGNWTCETTMWMKADAPPVTSKGSMTNKMIMGGRYQSSTFNGNMMGMPFEGIATTGYDNAKKKYISTWVDNMGTGIMVMEGTWDEGSRSITYTGKMMNPANGKECEMKQIYKMVDDKNEVMEMYGPDSQTGKQYKTMEIKLTRK